MASMGNASLGGQSTATIGAGPASSQLPAHATSSNAGSSLRDYSSQHDFPSLTISDDFPLELQHEFENASVYGKLFFFCLFKFNFL